ncbi:methylamine utilization protein MauG, partial [bacterium]|nr:methylamine utilization protein MauG [bacterium]
MISLPKLVFSGVITLLGLTAPSIATPSVASIGGAIFQDTNLSRPKGQACISCHDPNHAFADPRQTSPGAT